MTLTAGTDKLKISTTDLHYIIGGSEVRQHDACYYEIIMDEIAVGEEKRQELIGSDNKKDLKLRF